MIGKYCHVYTCKWFLSIMTGCFFLGGCVNTNSNTTSSQDIPIIDLAKNYPEKEFAMDDADKEYIPLETTDDVLADSDFSIEYVSDNRIVGVNKNRGDVFVFGRDGKIISFFNHKGEGNIEYLSIQSFVFDEKAQEIFVADQININRCMVYSENGNYLRQLNYPDSSWIAHIYNFDEHTLFAYNEYREGFDADEINQKTPYVLLSKKDGSEFSRLDISFSKRRSARQRINLGEGITNASLVISSYATKPTIKYGNEYIISDKSSDTVYLITQNKKLTPLFVRTPTVFEENRLSTLSVYFKTDTHLFFNSFTYVWSEVTALIKKGQRPSFSNAKKIAYDIRTGQVFSVSNGPSGINDAPANTAVRVITADLLLDDLENGKLEGKLKQVAQSIDWDDNPVVEIVKYK